MRQRFCSIGLFLLCAILLVPGTAYAQKEIRARSEAGSLVVQPPPPPVAVDTEGPQIVILEPAVRGLKVVHSGERITVRGQAIDSSGIASVSVNGTAAMIAPDGAFSTEIRLPVGTTTLLVRAVDRRSNEATHTFEVERTSPVVAKGRYRALIVGIDSYQGAWQPLRNAARDARAVAEVLATQYGFTDIDTLYNEAATRTSIITALERLVERAEPEDHVLIYYSGHGQLDERFNRGYWVPANARSGFTGDFISNSDVVTYVSGIEAKHTLLVADACFAGDLFRSGTMLTQFEASERFYREAMRTPSRKAMTSGNVEPVMDGGRDGHSVFAYYFLKALRENTAPFLADVQVFDALRIPVTNNSEQTPQFNPIKNAGDEGGNFVFTRVQQ